jgi:hypothetical protein
MKMLRHWPRVAFIAVGFVHAQALHAATWYVTTNGYDEAAGTDWATAKQTIQSAIDIEPRVVASRL